MEKFLLMSEDERNDYVNRLKIKDILDIKTEKDLGFSNAGVWSFLGPRFGQFQRAKRIAFKDCPCSGDLISGKIYLVQDNLGKITVDVSFCGNILYTFPNGTIISSFYKDTLTDVFQKKEFCKNYWNADREKELEKIYKKYNPHNKFLANFSSVTDSLYKRKDLTLEEAYLDSYHIDCNNKKLSKEELKLFGEEILTRRVEEELRDKVRDELSESEDFKELIQKVNNKYGTNFNFDII